MYISPETMDVLLKSGLAGDKIMEIVRAFERDAEAMTPKLSNSSGAERQRKYRERKKEAEAVAVTGDITRDVTRDERGDACFPETKVSPTPPSKTQPLPPPIVPPNPVTEPAAAGFERFWAAYPSKVGKRAAEKAFPAACKRVGHEKPIDVMIAAVERQKRTKRWREGIIPNPATWLNQDRWLDGVEPAEQAQPPPQVVDPEVIVARERHYRDTGEWRPGWGPKPDDLAA